MKENILLKNKQGFCKKQYPRKGAAKQLKLYILLSAVASIPLLSIQARIILLPIIFGGFKLVNFMRKRPEKIRQTLAICLILINIKASLNLGIQNQPIESSPLTSYCRLASMPNSRIDKKKLKSATRYVGGSVLLGHATHRLINLNLYDSSLIDLFSALGEFFIGVYYMHSHLEVNKNEVIYPVNDRLLLAVAGCCLAPSIISGIQTGSQKSLPDVILNENQTKIKTIVENTGVPSTTPISQMPVTMDYLLTTYPLYTELPLYPTISIEALPPASQWIKEQNSKIMERIWEQKVLPEKNQKLADKNILNPTQSNQNEDKNK